MIALELIKEIDSKEIVDLITANPSYFEMIDWDNRISENEKNRRKNIIKNKLIEELEKIKTKEILKKDDSEILIVHKRIDDDNYYDTSILHLSDFITKKYNIEDYSNEFKIDTSEQYINPLYSTVFMNRNDLLKLEVSNASIEKYGKNIVAASIANELTTFAIDEIERNKIIEEHISELEKAIKETENKEQKTYTPEEVFEHLGYKDTRTEEEKESERIIYQKKLEKGINEQNELIVNTFNLYC